ncbi:death-inducer obliterator 1 [Pontoporia blainvillei]|uniref:Death-inducer obliterator 1 n=1 Tax=Pontoporia blainvillei TaxID=48723 RepID=A0ABX0SDB8_PONBL|nr:death-inducer obliterator 1 [Pontoporia blainvillei]
MLCGVPCTPASLSGPLFSAAVKEDRRAEAKVAVAVVPKKVAPPGSSGGSKQPLPRNLLPKKSPPFVAAAKPAVKKTPPGFKGTIPKRPWLSAAPSPSGSAPSAKQAGLAPVAATSASRKFPSSAASVGAIRKPGTTSVSLAPPAPGRLGPASPASSQPNSQIRQNIRRSLKEILWKRVTDSDDLIMTENEVGKIALHIEKEMFNLFRVTDNRYKSKYRSLMFNLKDPKNQKQGTYSDLPFRLVNPLAEGISFTFAPNAVPSSVDCVFCEVVFVAGSVRRDTRDQLPDLRALVLRASVGCSGPSSC